MPTQAADEVARSPANPAPRPAHGYITARRQSQRREDRLTIGIQRLTRFVLECRFQFSTEAGKVCDLDISHVLNHLHQIPAAAARTFAKRLALRRQNGGVECSPTGFEHS